MPSQSPPPVQPGDIQLAMTCRFAPEQYDAYLCGELAGTAYAPGGRELVGCLHLRDGVFTVQVPGPGGDIVYHAEPEGDGTFTHGEREMYLSAARSAIAARLNGSTPPSCGTPMIHPDQSAGHCTLPKDHQVLIEDSDHVDEHGCFAPVLVHQATIREVARVGREWPDGVHTCAELQELEPGRRPCTCGRCPRPGERRVQA